MSPRKPKATVVTELEFSARLSEHVSSVFLDAM